MDKIVFTNATVIDVTSGAKPNATITVVGERIKDVRFGRPADPGSDASTVDLQGRSVMAGMYNCHYHATYKDIARHGMYVPIGMEAPPALQALRAAYHVGLALESGFTGIIGAGGPYAVDVSLKAAINEGIMRGPRIMAGSRDVSTTAHLQDRATPWHWDMADNPGFCRCDGADSFRRGVRDEVKRGAEIIKIFLTCGHPEAGAKADMDMSREELAAAIETAHQCGVKARAHIARRDAIMTAVTHDIDVVDHGDGLDEACIELMVKKGTFLVPSVLFPYLTARTVKSQPAYDIMMKSVDQMLKILPLANESGVKIVLGDDYGAGELEHGNYGDELDFYVNVAGIRPLDVLRWATSNGADMMDQGHELGAIKPGMLADFIVIEGDPVADISILKDRNNISLVLKGGQIEKDRLGPGGRGFAEVAR